MMLMRRCSKLIAVLLSLAMCLSLLPAGAFAVGNLSDYNEYNQPPEEITDPRGPSHTKDIIDAIADSVEEKVIDGTQEAAGGLNDTTHDAVYGSGESAEPTDPDGHHTAEDVINGLPTKSEDGTTEPPSENDSVLQNADKAADAAETFQQAVTGAVTVEDENGENKTVDTVVGEVVRNEDGTIDTEKSSGKALEAAQAAESAEAAATDAANALTDAQAAVESRDQAALNTAKDQATQAYEQANSALETANSAYDTAKTAVEAAQAAYDKAVEALTAAGYTPETIGSALEEAKAAVEKAQKDLGDAKDARDAAQKQRDYAQVYAQFASALADVKAGEDGVQMGGVASALDALEELYGKYGAEVEKDEALAALADIYAGGNAVTSTWYDSGRYWSWSGLAGKQEAVQKMEADAGITDGDQETTLYKVFKHLIDKNVSGGIIESKEDQALKAAADGIVTFWETEKQLAEQRDSLKTGAEIPAASNEMLMVAVMQSIPLAEVKALEEKFSGCTDEEIAEILTASTIKFSEEEKVMILNIGGESIASSITPDSIYNIGYSGLLGDAYYKIFTQTQDYGTPGIPKYKTPYQLVQEAAKKVGASDQVQHLVTYLDLLQYELRCQ